MADVGNLWIKPAQIGTAAPADFCTRKKTLPLARQGAYDSMQFLKD
jgi:hypothetical protein